MNGAPRPVDILLVEDNTADAMLTAEAFEDARLINRLHLAKDGVEAMQFLRREGKFADAPRPDLILLDLNLPRKDGRKVLAEIRGDPTFAGIPVVVLTSSSHEKDVATVYGLHANAFVQKPVDLAKFLDVVAKTKDYWLAIVTLPPNRAPEVQERP